MRYATATDLAALPCDLEVAPEWGHAEAALGRAEVAVAAGVGGGDRDLSEGRHAGSRNSKPSALG